MKVATINKTIVVWEKLNDKEAKELISTLSEMLSYYASKHTASQVSFPLKDDFNYLSIIYKNGYSVLSVIKNKQQMPVTITCSPILNGDKLYESLPILKNYQRNIDKRLRIIKNFSNYEWINLSINKEIDNYLLSPNINPDNFIKSLQKGTLSETYRKFLSEVGIALDKMQPEQQITIENIDIDYEE